MQLIVVSYNIILCTTYNRSIIIDNIQTQKNVLLERQQKFNLVQQQSFDIHIIKNNSWIRFIKLMISKTIRDRKLLITFIIT